MPEEAQLPDCIYRDPPVYVRPESPTPSEVIYLSNLDDQKFLRFSVKYLYLFRTAVCFKKLKSSLARVLVDYYPLAGRLRAVPRKDDDHKLEVDCNGEGALFSVGFMDFSVEEFLQSDRLPNMSWRKLLYRKKGMSFLEAPLLVVQVTNLRCGGMFLCVAINHCVADGIGGSQFLNAWSHFSGQFGSKNPNVSPYHCRTALRPRNPRLVSFLHPEYFEGINPTFNLQQRLLSQQLIPTSTTFSASLTRSLIRTLPQPPLPQACTFFDALAAHVWRTWAKALNLPLHLKTKLLFSANIRKRMKPQLPEGFYGNGFVLACAEVVVAELVGDLWAGVKKVQEVKMMIKEDYVRSTIDLLEDERRMPDFSASLLISSWCKMGLEDLDFGEGRPLHVGSLTSEMYCVFLPVVGDLDAKTVLISVPESSVKGFQFQIKNF